MSSQGKGDMLSKKRIKDDEILVMKNSKKQGKEEANSIDKVKTLSIAIPSSIIDNAQSKELRSYLVGQIARTCAIFRVDEIIIYHDSLNKGTIKDKLRFCLTNLQYLETPQYLRKTLFPFSEDLSNAGLMNPLDISHHLRTIEFCQYREGIVLNRPVKDGKGSWLDIGLKKYCFVETSLPEKTRVTVRLDSEAKDIHDQSELYVKNGNTTRSYKGTLVSSLEPKSNGLYWGYIVRVADTFEDIFLNSTFNSEKYDLIIGTSDKGKNSEQIKFKSYKHALIVFGGIQGLEGVVDNEEKSHIKSTDIESMFDHYVNTCPNQGSRTIRTEEAIMITLACLQNKL